MSIPHTLPQLLAGIIDLLILLIIIEIIISYLIAFGVRISPYHPFVKLVRQIVNPLLEPVRRILPPPHKTWGWDFSPLLLILLLQFIQNFLWGL
jgi:YggT family protein